MTRLRRALGPLAALWLSCQIGTIVLAPVVLRATAADVHGAACTCGHGAAATCPMHHPKPAGDPNNRCSMQASHDTGAAVLTALVGAAGLIPESTASGVASVPSMYMGPTGVDVRGERSGPPDPPPPRL